jgi:hypothetical protein
MTLLESFVFKRIFTEEERPKQILIEEVLENFECFKKLLEEEIFEKNGNFQELTGFTIGSIIDKAYSLPFKISFESNSYFLTIYERHEYEDSTDYIEDQTTPLTLDKLIWCLLSEGTFEGPVKNDKEEWAYLIFNFIIKQKTLTQIQIEELVDYLEFHIDSSNIFSTDFKFKYKYFLKRLKDKIEDRIPINSDKSVLEIALITNAFINSGATQTTLNIVKPIKFVAQAFGEFYGFAPKTSYNNLNKLRNKELLLKYKNEEVEKAKINVVNYLKRMIKSIEDQ